MMESTDPIGMTDWATRGDTHGKLTMRWFPRTTSNLDSGHSEDDEEEEHTGLGKQSHNPADLRRHRVDEAGNADMGAFEPAKADQ